jgi:hypothetical protein
MKHSAKLTAVAFAMLGLLAGARAATTGSSNAGTTGTAATSGQSDSNTTAPNINNAPNSVNPNGQNPNMQNGTLNPDSNLPSSNGLSPLNTNPNNVTPSMNPDGTPKRAAGGDRRPLRAIRESVLGISPDAAAGTSMSDVQNLRVFRQNGKIVLSGTVGSQAEKDAAGERANAAAGGQPVINNLIVR